MQADVVLLPRDLRPADLAGRTVVVFDVLRATTSMAAALASDVDEIRIFGDTGAAAAAYHLFDGPKLLCGEVDALPPPGFDLGNSPGAFQQKLHAGRTMFISTTNGTRAILAARGAAQIFIGSLVNASAVARAVSQTGRDVTLLCSGTNGQVAMEDALGCGAVLDALSRYVPVSDISDIALMARRLFVAARSDLAAALRDTRGGRNVARAGLPQDITFCANLDSLDVVGMVAGEPPIIRRMVTA